MMERREKIKFLKDEKIVLLSFWAVYLLHFFYNHDYDLETLGIHFLFTLNYVACIAFISYYLLPKYFYRQKHLQFLGFTFLALFVTSFIEENVLEQVFYPLTSGNEKFSLVSTLLEIGDFILYIFFGVGFKVAWDSLIRQKNYERIEKEKLESELKYLKFQVSPHMLFNTLNNIYSFALYKSDKTAGMILKLSGIMRYLLYEAADNYVPLKKELGFLQDYIALQSLSLEGRGKVSYTNTGEAEGYYIAPLVLISFVENCFKHSLENTVRDIDISVRSAISNGHFTFYCENSFTEPDKTTEEPGAGIGMENVIRRLDILYPSRYTLHRELLNNKYIVKLAIQLV